LFLQGQHEWLFMDSFETFIALLGAVACVFAASRCSRRGKEVWTVVAVYFAIMAIADFHDVLVDALPQIAARFPASLEFLGWFATLPLVLLAFFPLEEEYRPRWSWLSVLNCVQVTLVFGVAYFHFIYLPHVASNLAWTSRGRPEDVRNMVVSAALLLRAVVDPSSRARALYWRVGGSFAALTLCQAIFQSVFPAMDKVTLVGRPAALLALAIFAARWEDTADRSSDPANRSIVPGWFISLLPALGPVLVLMFARGTPTRYVAGVEIAVGTSIAIFILRAGLAEYQRQASARLQNALYRIAEQASYAEDLSAFYAAIHNIVGRLLYAGNFYIALYDAEKQLLSFPYFADEYVPEKQPTKMGNGLTEYVLRTGETLLASPAVFDQLLRSGQVEPAVTPLICWLGAPLKSGNSVFGAMVVQSHNEGIDYGEQEKTMLTFVAQHVAGAIERKRSEQAVRESESRLRALIQHAPEAIVVIDAESNQFTEANENAERLFGCSRDELLKARPRSFLAVKPPDERPLKETYQEHTERVLAGEEQRFERKVLGIGGDERMCEVRLVRLPSTERKLVRASFIDITERKTAEEALRCSEAELRSLIDNAPYGITRASVKEDRFLAVNPALVKMLGYETEAEVLALRLSTEVYWDGEGRAKLLTKLPETGRFSGVEIDWRRKDGRPMVVRISGRRTTDAHGTGEVLETFIEDFTEYRVLQGRFLQSQKMEAVGRLVGGIAHDFNNVLMIIMSNTRFLDKGLADHDPVRKRAIEILKAAERAASLIKQLLAFSRKQVLQKKRLDLNALVIETEKMLRPLVGEDIRVVTELDSELAPVVADSVQLIQVLMNLAVNARDAMAEGGKLILATRNAQLDEEYCRKHPGALPGKYVVITVTDTGTGMSPEVQGSIFEPFFTTKREGEGTGLGLSTAYGIVEQSEGHIDVQSKLGQGTTFTIYLPAAQDSVMPVPPIAQVAPTVIRRGSEIILLVEDEPALRELLSEFLQMRGYRVLEAGSGAEAMAEIARNPQIDLLITDFVLPDTRGSRLYESISAMVGEIKTIYMSGYAEATTMQERLKQPGSTFLQKPFSHETLLKHIRAALEPQQPSGALKRNAVEV
jgi:PAS domain S-box-containing protein